MKEGIDCNTYSKAEINEIDFNVLGVVFASICLSFIKDNIFSVILKAFFMGIHAILNIYLILMMVVTAIMTRIQWFSFSRQKTSICRLPVGFSFLVAVYRGMQHFDGPVVRCTGYKNELVSVRIILRNHPGNN